MEIHKLTFTVVRQDWDGDTQIDIHCSATRLEWRHTNCKKSTGFKGCMILNYFELFLIPIERSDTISLSYRITTNKMF